MGLRFNWLVKHGKVRAPIVIGRDHLDTGSVASPNRETEGMKDGSDAIADWPLLNALLNTACGASWVSLHHGGGVGIGYSIHAGMVVVADGTPMADRRLERVLTADPGTGVMRHADAGYDARDRDGARAGRRPADGQRLGCARRGAGRRSPRRHEGTEDTERHSHPQSCCGRLVPRDRPPTMKLLENIGQLATCRAEGGQGDIHAIADGARWSGRATRSAGSARAASCRREYARRRAARCRRAAW